LISFDFVDIEKETLILTSFYDDFPFNPFIDLRLFFADNCVPHAAGILDLAWHLLN